MAQIVWTAEAQVWLQRIYDYIAAENEAAAYRTVRAIHEQAEILGTFPHIGYTYREHPDVKVLLFGHYRIAYRIEGSTVEILGVFHGAMEMRHYLTLP